MKLHNSRIDGTEWFETSLEHIVRVISDVIIEDLTQRVITLRRQLFYNVPSKVGPVENPSLQGVKQTIDDKKVVEVCMNKLGEYKDRIAVQSFGYHLNRPLFPQYVHHVQNPPIEIRPKPTTIMQPVVNNYAPYVRFRPHNNISDYIDNFYVASEGYSSVLDLDSVYGAAWRNKTNYESNYKAYKRIKTVIIWLKKYILKNCNDNDPTIEKMHEVAKNLNITGGLQKNLIIPLTKGESVLGISLNQQ